jgi:hypothetical protein
MIFASTLRRAGALALSDAGLSISAYGCLVHA